MATLARLSLLTACAVLIASQPVWAQYKGRGQPPKNLDLNSLRDVTVDGTLEGVQGNILQVKASAGHPYLVALLPASKLGVTGMCKPDFIKPGMLVSFTAEVSKDKKVELSEAPEDLAIIAPSETNVPGVFPEDRENPDSTRSFVRATVRSYRDGKLTVAAGGKQIIAPVPEDAEIKLESTDLSIVRQGDSIKVMGKQVKEPKTEGNNVMPGQVVGQTVDIKLQETLSAATLKRKK